MHFSSVLLIVGLSLFTFLAHYPGQASVDAIVQLQDGISGIYDSNQPPAMSWLMAKLSLPGVLALNIFLFGAAAAVLLRDLRGRTAWHNTALIFLFCFPVVFIYNGIVWKDVLFANAAVLGLLLLPRVDRRGSWVTVVLSAAVITLAVAVRQQGLLVSAAAIAYLALTPKLLWPLGNRIKVVALWLVTYVSLGYLLDVSVAANGDISRSNAFVGPVYQLAMFDIGGIASRNPEVSFPALESLPTENFPRSASKRSQILAAMEAYHPSRQDPLGKSVGESGVPFYRDATLSDWQALVSAHPVDYFLHRFRYMSWLLGANCEYPCSPFFFGISDSPASMLPETKLTPGFSGRAELLKEMGLTLSGLFRSIYYLVLSVIVLGALLYGGWRNSSSMILIQLAGLTYTGSYFLVGIACDFRYTYFSTVAALFGLVYCVLTKLTTASAVTQLPPQA